MLFASNSSRSFLDFPYFPTLLIPLSLQPNSVKSKMNTTALAFALGTVLCWGIYSVMLHMGSVGMKPMGLLDGKPVPPDFLSLRMKAFLQVGIAYFIVGVIIPLIIIWMRTPSVSTPATLLAGRGWDFPKLGLNWSFAAGMAGALGAFFLLMGLSAGTTPLENKILPLIVPAIVFAGAPIVNTLVSTTKEGNWGYVNWKFILGMVLAAAGTAMVMKFKPVPEAPTPTPAAAPAVPAPTPKVSQQTLPAGYHDVRLRQYNIT